MTRTARELFEAADRILSDPSYGGTDLSALRLAKDTLAPENLDTIRPEDPKVIELAKAVSTVETEQRAAAPATAAERTVTAAPVATAEPTAQTAPNPGQATANTPQPTASGIGGTANGAGPAAGNAAPPPPQSPGSPTFERITTRKTYLLVALSVLTMYVVACMTIVHNKGVALLAEIEQLAAKEPERRFGELERLLLHAAPGSADGRAGSLAAGQEPAYLMLNELRGLDAHIYQLDQRIIQFYEESHWPAPGMNTTLAVLKAPFGVLGSTASAVPPSVPAPTTKQGGSLQSLCQEVKARTTVPKADIVAATGLLQQPMAGRITEAGAIPVSTVGSDPAVKPEGDKLRQPTAGGSLKADEIPADARENDPSASPPNEKTGTDQTTASKEGDTELTTLPVVLSVKMSDVVTQACGANLRFISTTIPSIKEWITRIRQTTSNYSFWLLPGLYAALGSLIYYMRLVLDPDQDDPDLHRIIHRIAMAALAGIVVGWLWQPSLAANVQVQAIGASLFIIAFIVGYSIDVFFILLDRLEKIATAAIQQLGNAPATDQRPKPTG